MKDRIKPYLPGILIFVLFFVIGTISFKDHGMAWDEQDQHSLGTVAYNFVSGHDEEYKTYINNQYGVAFELPLVLIEKGLGLSDSRDIYLMRHFVTHLFFLFSALCAYVLFYRLFRKRFVAALGMLMILCEPRLYAHSFYNSKDIPLLGAMLIALAVAQLAFEKNKIGWYIALGLCCGYAAAIRILGLMLPAAFIVFFIIDIAGAIRKKEKPLRTAIAFLCFLGTFFLSGYLLWPALWHDPLKFLIDTFQTFAHFNLWDYGVLFEGRTSIASQLPWYYIPVWFCISTPELWLAAGLLGVVWILASFVKHPLQYIANNTGRNFMLYLGILFIPVSITIMLHSIVYDDWRHFYFAFIAFVPVALFGIDKLLQTKAKRPVQILCLAQLCMVALFMWRYHPFQEVYFNHLVSHESEALRRDFELDYWGPSYKQGLEYVLEHDTSSKIRIAGDQSVINHAVLILPAASRDRLELVGRDENPEYFMTNFRNHPADYDYKDIFYNVKVLNSSILRVYKCGQ